MSEHKIPKKRGRPKGSIKPRITPSDKKCNRCGNVKESKEFRKKKSNVDGLQNWCKTCVDEYQKEYRHHPSSNYNKNYWKQKRKEIRAKVFRYLLEHPCVDCGEKDPIVLEFDHVRGDKEYNISSMISGVFAWERIEQEIEKCDVRCANCHRRKTAKQFGYYGKTDVLS